MKKAPLHPFLFTAYFVIFFVTKNSTTVAVFATTLFLALLFAAAVFFAHHFLFQERGKGAVLTTVFLFLFFSFGQLSILLAWADVKIGPLYLGPTKIVLLLSVMLYLAMFMLLRRAVKEGVSLNVALNVITLLLLVINFSTIVFAGDAFLGQRLEEPAANSAAAPANAPDFYFIVLDGFAGHDVLKKTYNYNNSKFLRRLEKRGFFVSWNSNANYAQTLLSLSSNLNLQYLDAEKSKVKGKSGLHQLLMNNKVFQYLKEKSYSIRCFATGYSYTEFKEEDYIAKFYYPDEFQENLLSMTAFNAVQEFIGSDLLYAIHRDRIEGTFAELPNVAEPNAPDFVFAHILCPHPPFVFGKNGAPREPAYPYSIADCSHLVENYDCTSADYQKKYVSQIKYCEKLLLKSVDEILATNKNAVIIVQSDHGPGSTIDWDNYEQPNFDERMSILYAVYTPEHRYRRFYQGVSPVNTFRILFNKYFGENFKVLPDVSYFSGWSTPFRFKDVTALVR